MLTTTRRAYALAAALLLLAAGGWRLLPGTRPGAVGGRAATLPAPAQPATARPLTLPWAASAATREEPGAAGLAGEVVDAISGAPIPGAELTFSLADAAASARSEGDGSFQFVAPQPGRWRLAAATAAGYFPFAPEWGHSPVTFDARPGRSVGGVTIRLERAEPMEGRVLDPEGRPAAGAEIRLLGPQLQAALVPIADRFVSGADGTFTFAAPEGSVLEARAVGFFPGRADVDFLARARGRVTIQLMEEPHALPPSAPISGRVIEPGGAPLAGARVSAARELGYGVSDVTSASVLTGADGAFTLEEMGPGAWRITARAGDRVPGEAPRVAPGTRDLVLALEDGGRLRGCVTDASSGQPVVALTVHLFEVRSALRVIPRESRASIDPTGCYALDGLVPGRARVIVSAPGYAASAARDVEIPGPGRGEAVADARLERGGRVTGVVMSGGTGAPIEGARVTLEGQLQAATSALPALAEAATDAAGRFALAGLPRRASLFVAAAGHHSRIVSGLESTPGATVGPIVVTLRAAGPDEETHVDLAGIGVGFAPHGDGLTIARVFAGSGAERAGLSLGDVILGVDGRLVTELGEEGAKQAIRGPEGTVVTLTVRKGERTETVLVTRSVVQG